MKETMKFVGKIKYKKKKSKHNLKLGRKILIKQLKDVFGVTRGTFYKNDCLERKFKKNDGGDDAGNINCFNRLPIYGCANGNYKIF